MEQETVITKTISEDGFKFTITETDGKITNFQLGRSSPHSFYFIPISASKGKIEALFQVMKKAEKHLIDEGFLSL